MTLLSRLLLAALLALAPLTALAGGGASRPAGGELAAPRAADLEAPMAAAHAPVLPPLLGVEGRASGDGAGGGRPVPVQGSASAIECAPPAAASRGVPAPHGCRPHAERLPYDALAPPHRG
jgi:hypothetical protein